MTLESLAEHERILAFGGQASGKSMNVVYLAHQLQEEGHKLVVIDRGNGIAKAFKEYGMKHKVPLPKNIDYILVNEWEDIENGIALAMDPEDGLKPGDWLVFDEAGKIWDLAQSTYTQRVYGESVSEHTLAARAAAEAKVKHDKIDTTTVEGNKAARVERQKGTMYTGMDGKLDWPFIKRIHNDECFDRAIVSGRFHILTLTAATWSDDDEHSSWWKDFDFIKSRPVGEKNHIFRHDSIVYVEKAGNGEYYWRTALGGSKHKDRGYPKASEEIFTDIGLVASMQEYHARMDAEALA